MKLLYLLFFVASTSCNQANKKSPEALIGKTDSLPTKIKYQIIKEKCFNYVEAFKRQKAFTTDEYIDIVRIYNTISLNRLRERDNIFKEFDDIFSKTYLNNIVNIFDAKLSRGLGFYSKKYDIDIGGAAPNKNSIFKLEEK